MTPDAVLHRYVELAFQQRVDIEALYRVITLDADLLGRWVNSLGCRVEPAPVQGAMAALPGEDLRGLAQAQTWTVVPLGSAPRLAFDQWQAVLRASCVAESLARRVDFAGAESARLRTLLAISGTNVAHDPLMAELVEFRGIPVEQLVDAHPLLRMFAVVEALEHQSADAAAAATETLFRIDRAGFDSVVAEAGTAATQLVAAARIDDSVGEGWRDRLWMHAQITAFSNVIAGQPSSDAIESLSRFVTRGLFNQVPRCFLVDAGRGMLMALGGDDLSALRIAVSNPLSVIARALREGVLIEADESEVRAVADRQVMRRLDAGRICAAPVLVDDSAAGVLVYRLTDDDRRDVAEMMQAYAAALGRWLTLRRHDEERRALEREHFSLAHQKGLRELVHEANNPLSVVQNYLHVLELRLEGQQDVQAQLRLIGQEIGRASAIIARAAQASGSVAHPAIAERFDLNDVARRVMELIKGQAGKQRISVKAALPDEAVLVLSDQDRVIQIMTNLVRNGIEAMGRGGTLTIETTRGVYRQGRAGVEFVVRDDGPGIPDDVLARLYEPKKSSKSGDHAGLGLHITAQLVEALQGAIDVRTRPGQGTSFSVFLPDLTNATD